MIALMLLLLSKILNRGIQCRPALQQVDEAWQYVNSQGMNTSICILIDYSLPSGCNRLWVWDFDDEEVIFECPVAHGRGRGNIPRGVAHFSNAEGSWLSSLGKSRIAERYTGRFGTSYRLDGLESTNSNLRPRCVVMHAYHTVPPKPIFPLPSGRSKGCVMVAKRNMEILDQILQNRSNVLLYTYSN
ncbi:MAG: murein L,D-transpeptidase catalytic domain family protein [Bacteroidales bacterium]|nr:murein L,D-transpeptidase catalytic domain family protein [Bacteroidales bacterium]